MSRPQLVRPGGRSERIQKAVHDAVRSLRAEGLETLSIPLIAERAGVTPSTIYRRWSNLPELLDAVAAAYLHGDKDPPNTGSFEGDLRAWVDGFVDDFSSALGRSMLVERVSNVELAQRTAGYAFSNLRTFVRQAEARHETVMAPDRLMDLIVAPIVYRTIFAHQKITPEYRDQLIRNVLGHDPVIDTNAQPSFENYVVFD